MSPDSALWPLSSRLGVRPRPVPPVACRGLWPSVPQGTRSTWWLSDGQVSRWGVWGWLLCLISWLYCMCAPVPDGLPRVLLSGLDEHGRLVVASQLPGSSSHLPDLTVHGFAAAVPPFFLYHFFEYARLYLFCFFKPYVRYLQKVLKTPVLQLPRGRIYSVHSQPTGRGWGLCVKCGTELCPVLVHLGPSWHTQGHTLARDPVSPPHTPQGMLLKARGCSTSHVRAEKSRVGIWVSVRGG